MTDDEILKIVEQQYPIPEPCCKAKRKKIERLREQYIKYIKRNNDRVRKDKQAV
jgi:hypothetical protein